MVVGCLDARSSAMTGTRLGSLDADERAQALLQQPRAARTYSASASRSAHAVLAGPMRPASAGADPLGRNAPHYAAAAALSGYGGAAPAFGAGAPGQSGLRDDVVARVEQIVRATSNGESERSQRLLGKLV